MRLSTAKHKKIGCTVASCLHQSHHILHASKSVIQTHAQYELRYLVFRRIEPVFFQSSGDLVEFRLGKKTKAWEKRMGEGRERAFVMNAVVAKPRTPATLERSTPGFRRTTLAQHQSRSAVTYSAKSYGGRAVQKNTGTNLLT